MQQVVAPKQRPEFLDCTGVNGAEIERVRTAQEEWAEWLHVPIVHARDLGEGVTLEMVLVPPGKFMMGSPEDEEGRDINETLHEVELTRPIYLAKNPVTQEQYMQVANLSNPCYFGTGSNGDGQSVVAGLGTRRFPVEQLMFHKAVEFCERLATHGSGKFSTFRLPTEAEWEYACRAGSRTPFHFGRFLNGFRANCNGNYPYGTSVKGKYLGRTCEVGKYRANDFGLNDMHGNVWEWCADWYGGYGSSKQVDPMGSQVASDDRVIRGGGWDSIASHCRAARRAVGGRGFYHNGANLGFRVALVIPSEPELTTSAPARK